MDAVDNGAEPPGAGLGEALAVWTLLLTTTVVVLVTYARLAPEELYNVSGEGPAGGLSRVLVHLNYPLAIAAVPLVLLALDRLPSRAWLAGAPAIALCALIAVPGVLDETDLDARPVNAVPALGVAIAAGLTVAAVRRHGASLVPPLPGDRARLALAAGLLVAAVPWIAVELGFHVPGDVLLSEEVDEDGLAAVHLGHHHGTDGIVLAAVALVLSRAAIAGERLAVAYAALLSLVLAYGLANAVEDGWHEQVAKRGWVEWRFPAVQRPDLSWYWGVIVLAALAVYALALRPPRRR